MMKALPYFNSSIICYFSVRQHARFINELNCGHSIISKMVTCGKPSKMLRTVNDEGSFAFIVYKLFKRNVAKFY